MTKPETSLLSYCVAGLIPLLLTIGSLFHCPRTISREVTDHCGRPINDQQGNSIFEIDQWATWLANWPFNLSVVLALLLFTYFIFLDQHDRAPEM